MWPQSTIHRDLPHTLHILSLAGSPHRGHFPPSTSQYSHIFINLTFQQYLLVSTGRYKCCLKLPAAGCEPGRRGGRPLDRCGSRYRLPLSWHTASRPPPFRALRILGIPGHSGRIPNTPTRSIQIHLPRNMHSFQRIFPLVPCHGRNSRIVRIDESS